ncbi:class I SAM-dependent methyltransferase [Candidatus Harpocratesius sp.]
MKMLSAEIYLHTINWKNRLKREIPFLSSILSNLIITHNAPRNILDLGCGPGKHINLLSNKFPNDYFIGIDISEQMITIAQKTVISDNKRIEKNHNRIKFIQKDFMQNNNDLEPNSFNFIYSLGNSMLLIMQKHDPFIVFEKISQLLSSRGFFFIQILNNSKPRSGYIASPVYTDPSGDNYYTIKRFAPDFYKSKMFVDFVECHHSYENNKVFTQIKQSSWPLITLPDIEEIFNQLNLNLVNVWENYLREPFSLNCSDALLLLAKKNS